MPNATPPRVDLPYLRRLKAEGRKFAMLTAYDFPTAALAQAAGIPVLLIGDSMGTVLLGHANTRQVPLSLMITLGQAVRRGAPQVYLVGDMPFEAMAGGDEAVIRAALQFRDAAGCDAVKIEAEAAHTGLVAKLARARVDVIAHLGLRPQSVLSPDGYRAQARDDATIAELVNDARRMIDAGAVMLLLEAVPPEAAQAVVSAINVPVIGCGAGPACDGHVVVTQDLLGLGAIRPPKFVPILANLAQQIEAAMRQYRESIESGSYPGAQHAYTLRRQSAGVAAEK